MKIALFSDIHANLPALEACLADMEARRPDAVYCLGDLVGYNIWPNEVVQEIRKRGIPTIAGNYDDGVGRNSDDCGCAYKTDIEKERGKLSISYTNEVILPGAREYLRSLPAHIMLQFGFGQETFNILLVHGSPRKVNEYLFEDREEKSLLRMMDMAGADIMFCGHTHKPYHRVLYSENEGMRQYKHVVNTGSVGKPKDGDPRGCYVILHIDEKSSQTDKDSIRVEFVRFEYDVEKAVKAVEDSSLPNAFADMLRTGT